MFGFKGFGICPNIGQGIAIAIGVVLEMFKWHTRFFAELLGGCLKASGLNASSPFAILPILDMVGINDLKAAERSSEMLPLPPATAGAEPLAAGVLSCPPQAANNTLAQAKINRDCFMVWFPYQCGVMIVALTTRKTRNHT